MILANGCPVLKSKTLPQVNFKALKEDVLVFCYAVLLENNMRSCTIKGAIAKVSGRFIPLIAAKAKVLF